MRLATALSLCVIAAIASLGAATQTVAALFQHQPALGGPALRIAGAPLYWPFSILVWSARWGDVHPKPFVVAEVVALVSAAGVVLIGVAATGAGAPILRRHGQSGWARFADVAAAQLFASQGATLGKFEGEIMAYDGPGHVLLVGASRSGKGRGHVVPTLLSWPRSALVLDVKGELADGDGRHGFVGVAGFRERLGPVLRFAPTKAASARFNPLFEVRKGENEVRDVQNVVEIIVDPAGDGRQADFWDRSAKQILTGLILHVLYSEPDERKTLAVVREKLRDLDTCAEQMRQLLHRRCPVTQTPQVHPEVLHAADSYLASEERVRSGVKATAESFFGVFADPLVAANTSASDFRVGDLMCHERAVTLFLQPPPSDAQRLMPLMRLVLNQITRALMESQTEDASGRPKRHDLLLLLDEFPQLGRLPFFETAMGAFAGYGLKAYLVCQSLNHIARAYGRDNVILDNVHVLTAFAAADLDTARTVAALAGETWQTVEHESIDRPRPLLGVRRGGTTYREEKRPLMLPGDVRQLPADEQIVFVAGAKPIRAKKLRFDAEPIFQSRLQPAALTSAVLSTGHDWLGVRPLAPKAASGALAPKRAAPKRAPAKPPAALEAPAPSNAPSGTGI